jgi:HSP20 family protein
MSLQRIIPRLFHQMERDFQRLAGDVFEPTQRLVKPSTSIQFSVPKVDVYETEEAYKVEAELPGVAKESINIEVKDDTLVLSSNFEQSSTKETPGETSDAVVKENKGEGRKYWAMERSWYSSSFQRAIGLPENVDKEAIQASFKDGLLTVSVPKLQQSKSESTKKVEIQ